MKRLNPITAERRLARGVAVALLGVAGWLLPVVAVAQSWQEMSPRQRYDAMQNYWDYERQPEANRRRLDQQYERWQQLSPEEQERVRRNYDKWQQLPPGEQQRFEEKYEKWKRQAEPPPPPANPAP